jgi:hypothetical protein
VPSLPVNPWTITRESLFNRTLIICGFNDGSILFSKISIYLGFEDFGFPISECGMKSINCKGRKEGAKDTKKK